MTVTSTTQTPYTTTSNTANNTKKKEETLDPNDHMLKTLDKEGNELLNQVLEGKTDHEKLIIKMMMDLNLSMEIKNGELTHITNIDNSKSNVISKLEAYVTMQRKLGNPDMAGTVAASEKFLEAYKASDNSYNKTDQKAEIQNTKATTEVQNETQEPIITIQQEIEIKQQASQTTSETEESPLATAIQESSQTQSVEQAKATGKLAEMEEKYKDIYTPIPETYSKADEDLQAQKISEAYPNYPFGSTFLELVNSFYDGEPIIPGNGITQKQKEQQEIAFQKAYDIFGGEDAYNKMQKDVQAIKYQYPINEWAKQGYADNSKELARFTNATIYEGLERGLSLEGATKEARSVENIFMDVSYGAKMLDDKLIKAGRMSPASEGGRKTVRMEEDFNVIKNAAMNLRAYGIDGAWNGKKFIENQKDMLQEITTKISQFNFMLDNKKLVDDARMELPEYSRGPINNEGYESWVREEVLPRMQVGYEVFSKYQIYDN